jgi:hypothetical protein
MRYYIEHLCVAFILGVLVCYFTLTIFLYFNL